ncbi:hypothetical protein QBC41DRAFT_144085 [Cercophora samala]|uniref:Protein kinase domain-containing protein n=1 Tax=Cercophora samala TaxID=330535 RepID=A0AA39ZL93_9PEZI|nr:hypothetical protein QBC41DRAFT_144085 [Cercophora samala]
MTATLGLTVQIGDLFGVTTVDHIFPPEPESLEALGECEDDSDNEWSDDGSDANDSEMDKSWLGFDIEYLDEYNEDLDDKTNSPILPQQEGLDIWERIQPALKLPRNHAYLNHAYLDWSLSKPRNHSVAPLPNQYHPPGSEAEPTMLGEIAERPRFHCVPVHMLSAVRGVLSGELLIMSTMIRSGPGRDLCLVWTIILDSAMKIVPGESGSLIVDQDTTQVYGHVIGSEPSGNGHVAPMMSIFAQIKHRFDSEDVRVYRPSGEFKTRTSLNGLGNLGPDQKTRYDSTSPHVQTGADNSDGLSSEYEVLSYSLKLILSLDPGFDKLISDALMGAMVISTSGAMFFPRRRFQTILSPETVVTQLRNHFGAEVPDAHLHGYAARIWNETRPFIKIFAILNLLGKIDSILTFLSEDIADDDLPLVPGPRRRGMDFDLRPHARSSIELKLFQKWSIYQTQSFEAVQWRFLAPVLTSGGGLTPIQHYRLADKHVLPFIKIEPADHRFIHGGMYVSKVQIHPDHHNFPSQDNIFGTMDIGYYGSDLEQEAAVVNSIANETDHRHHHITPILAMISREEESGYRLLVPWPQATLSEYWKKINPAPTLTVEITRWFMTQCAGLATALLELDKTRTRLIRSSPEINPKSPALYHHGNIEPGSILWFPDSKSAINDMGKLRITGFGTFNRLYNERYKAPEVRLRGFESPTDADARSDVWSLGCIYLEFVTWLLGRWGFLSKVLGVSFQPSRRLRGESHSLDHDDLFRVIRDHFPAPPMVIRNLLEILEGEMLIRNPEKRITLSELSKKVAGLAEECAVVEKCCKPLNNYDPLCVANKTSAQKPFFLAASHTFDGRARDLKKMKFSYF